MLRLNNITIWMTLVGILCVFCICQSAFAEPSSSLKKTLSKPVTYFKNLPAKLFRKKTDEASIEKNPNAGQAIYENEINNPVQAKKIELVKPNAGSRSDRFQSIPIHASQTFSNLQSSPTNITPASSNYRSIPAPLSATIQQTSRPIDKAPSFGQSSLRSSLRWTNGEIAPAPTPVLPLAPIPEQHSAPQFAPEFHSPRQNQRWSRLGLNETPLSDRLRYSSHQGKISIVVRDAPISSVLGLIAQQNGLNIVANSEVIGNVTLTLTDVSLDDALSSILLVNGYIWTRNNNILLVSRLSKESATSPLAQGKQVQVFPLNYVSATEIDKVVKGLLSPVGQSFITETAPTQKLKTREQLVVEDLPEYVARIAQYIQQVDFPPQQVYIEAHVLQVTLKDDNRHGVNFEEIIRFGNSKFSLKTTGFANPVASPAFFLGLESTDLNVLIEMLKTTTDTKTLASPKVMVLNGQEARIQIGEQLGYLVTTTTQTSTLQEVNFLDLGVVLKVTPQITENNQILMTVKPEVSSGRINPDTGLPEEDTTEVETTIMLNDGQGMIIGGLIKEIDTDVQSKIPIAGDLWLLGKMFQKQTVKRERHEVIIALIPKVMNTPHACLPGHAQKLAQATTPLYRDNLRPNHRPWEPNFPDAMYDPRRIKLGRIPRFIFNLNDPYPHPPEFYFPAVSEYSDPIFGGSHKIQPMVLSAESGPFCEN